MNERVNSYATIKNIVHSFTQTLKPFAPIFILKMICKKRKLSLVTGTSSLSSSKVLLSSYLFW